MDPSTKGGSAEDARIARSVDNRSVSSAGITQFRFCGRRPLRPLSPVFRAPAFHGANFRRTKSVSVYTQSQGGSNGCGALPHPFNHDCSVPDSLWTIGNGHRVLGGGQAANNRRRNEPGKSFEGNDVRAHMSGLRVDGQKSSAEEFALLLGTVALVDGVATGDLLAKLGSDAEDGALEADALGAVVCRTGGFGAAADGYTPIPQPASSMLSPTLDAHMATIFRVIPILLETRLR